MSGIITGPHFRSYFGDPGPVEVGTMVAVLEIGALGRCICLGLGTTAHYRSIVTSIAAGRVGDLLGRRGTLLIGAIVFSIGGVIQTFTIGFWTMVLGRIVSGFGVGLLSYVKLRLPVAAQDLTRLPEQSCPFIRARYRLQSMWVDSLLKGRLLPCPCLERRSGLYGVHIQHRWLLFLSRKSLF
jgi:MFS family permease